MGGKRVAAALGVLVGAGLLTGCCLLSGNPTVTISGPSTATTGTPVTFTATATGGSAPYTYMWSIGGSGSTVTHTFTSAGSHTIVVTVTDNCGKSATAMWPVTVSEGAGGGNLTGMWNGTIYDNRGDSMQFSLQLTHVGTNVTGTAYGGGLSSTGSGSYAAGTFQFQFQWWRTTTIVTLVGTYNPYANELSGDWMVGGVRGGSWRVRR
ncbi:PKD domain-containing protein [Candidatus Bipolaricaulota bacterium]|nr:PKD domain-containing protein [Candidatus Bipolaricaulota bacterium]